MGLIRSSIVIFLSTILFLSLFLGNLFLTLSWSLEYDAIQPSLEKFTKEQIQNLEINTLIMENYEAMEIYCLSYESFNVSEQGINIQIPCEVIKEGPSEVISYGTNETIKQIYFKDYECEFWECVKTEKQPTIIFSQKAQEYWHSKFYLTLTASILAFILLFIFTEKKRYSLTIAGLILILVSIPFRKINWALSILPDGNLAELFGLFFTRAYNVFLITIILGGIIFLTGIALEFFGVGMSITKFFRKASEETSENKDSFTKEEVKEIVKQEINKQEKKKEIKQIVNKELNQKQNTSNKNKSNQKKKN